MSEIKYYKRQSIPDPVYYVVCIDEPECYYIFYVHGDPSDKEAGWKYCPLLVEAEMMVLKKQLGLKSIDELQETSALEIMITTGINAAGLFDDPSPPTSITSK